MKTDVVIQNQKKRVHNIKILNTVPLFLNPLICLSNDLDVTSQMKMQSSKDAISTYFHNILYFMGEQNDTLHSRLTFSSQLKRLEICFRIYVISWLCL